MKIFPHKIKLLLSSFVCSVELAETEQADTDEFSQFVKVGAVYNKTYAQSYQCDRLLKASKHPPNELSVARCYSPGKTPPPSFPSSRAVSPSSSSPRSLCSRPRLRRERAQDIEDVDPYSQLRCTLHPPSPCVCSFHQPVQHRSAPGTPLNSSRRRHLRQQQRAPSAEEGGGGGAFLHVPFSRMRGKSLPEDMENTLDTDSLYLLKQFNIQGRKVNMLFLK